MKEKLILKLNRKYGKNFKTPLSKDLGVNVSTVRRWFNSEREIKLDKIKAILRVLSEK